VYTVASSVKKEGLRKWQAQWERAVKEAICISFISERKAEAQITDPNNT